MSGKFLSCDWGTSNFRLRLVDTVTLTVLAEEKSDQGIARTFALWQETGLNGMNSRVNFYLSVIQEHLVKLEKRTGNLGNVPVVVSGMASSTIGIMSLPYQELPFSVNGAGIHTHLILPSDSFRHQVLLISGISSHDDVMRGEETQLIGCIAEENETSGDGIYLFPGTHSKHIEVKAGKVIDFKTYMTGEFFDLLANHSILQTSIAKSESLDNNPIPEGFKQGVLAAKKNNLLHAAFQVRTNELFQKLSSEGNYAYLSGLLIGSELKDLPETDNFKIFLFSGSNLKSLYETALQVLGLSERVHTFPGKWVDEAVIRGQFKILKQHSNQS
ncbi:MAG: 2-dehydro-3-deoxygalactonokinase [Bacteroidota bacterium]|nr:2-dehydro-3-deoxygalactonokinase [Bacteroidota bacterium]